MREKLSVEGRFLLNQSLEEYQMYQELIETLSYEIQTYITKSPVIILIFYSPFLIFHEYRVQGM